MFSSRLTRPSLRLVLPSLRAPAPTGRRALSMRYARIFAVQKEASTTPSTQPRLPSFKRPFSSTPQTLATPSSPENPETPDDPNAQRPPWISVLESVSNGPWLHTTIPDERLRLAIAHGLLYQLLLYLSRPIDGVSMDGGGGGEEGKEGEISDVHAQYLSSFAVARVPPTSEIARARTASSKLVSGVLHQLNSVSPTSPLRSSHPGIFTLAESLSKLAEEGLKEGGRGGEVREGREWRDFWGEAQGVVVELAGTLSEAGFVLEAGEGGEGEGKA